MTSLVIVGTIILERPHSKPPVEATVIFHAAPARRPRPACSASRRAAPVHAHFDHAHFRHSLTDSCDFNSSMILNNLVHYYSARHTPHLVCRV